MIDKLFKFIEKSKCSYMAVSEIAEICKLNDIKEIYEGDTYDIKPGKYFVRRNNSSIILMNIPADIKGKSLNIIATHTDSPAFKLEPNCINVSDYITLSTEVYGGAIYSSWFDRPLSISGRVVVKSNGMAYERLVELSHKLVIPNLCVHFNRDINKGHEYDSKIELRPLLSNKKDLYDLLSDELKVSKDDILSFDLYLSSSEMPMIIGADNEFFLSPRIDNLVSVYTSLLAFIDSNDDSFKMMVAFDNEEVGSSTMQGAQSNFLLETIKRVYKALNVSDEEMYKTLSKSVLISADNAHAVHPNYPNISNKLNAPVLNGGIVIKYNASNTYTTNAISSAVVKMIADDNDIKYQEFVNREDIRGGSTLGNLLLRSVSMQMVDIGLPQLAMHSACETAGVSDLYSYYKFMKCYYDSSISYKNNQITIK